MDLKKLQSEIIRLKKEKDFCILAHSYVYEEIKDIADSFGLEFNQAHAPFRFKADEWKNEETFRDLVMPTFVRTLEVCGIRCLQKWLWYGYRRLHVAVSPSLLYATRNCISACNVVSYVGS